MSAIGYLFLYFFIAGFESRKDFQFGLLIYYVFIDSVVHWEYYFEFRSWNLLLIVTTLIESNDWVFFECDCYNQRF